MPELPEVETVRRIVEPQILGRKIVSVTIGNPQIIAHPSEAAFVKMLVGQTVCATGRRGKFMSILFADGDSMVLHLRMTGRLLIVPR